MSEFDPIEFGELRARVAAMEKTIDQMSTKIDTLLEIANRGRGALWLALTIGGVIGAVITLASRYVGH